MAWVGDGPDVVGNGWDVMVEALGKREVETTTLTRREKGLCNFAQAKKVRMGLFFAPLKGSCFCLFFIYFSGFAIDRSKKYIKNIKNHMKIDAVDPCAAADNPPHPLVTMVRCMEAYKPQNPVK